MLSQLIKKTITITITNEYAPNNKATKYRKQQTDRIEEKNNKDKNGNKWILGRGEREKGLESIKPKVVPLKSPRNLRKL